MKRKRNQQLWRCPECDRLSREEVCFQCVAEERSRGGWSGSVTLGFQRERRRPGQYEEEVRR